MNLGALIASLFGVVFGFLVALGLMRRGKAGAGCGSPWLAAMALTPGLGFGILSVGFFAFLFIADRNPGRLGILAGMAALIIGAWWLGAQRAAVQWNHTTTPRVVGWHRWVSVLLVLGTLTGALATFVYCAWANPEGGNDAIAIWTVRARLLYEASGEYRDLFNRITWPNNYPLMLPGANATLFSLADSVSMIITGGTSLAFFLGIPALGIFLLKQIGFGSWAAPFAAILLTTPIFLIQGASQYSDVPLAYFLLGASGCLASALQPDVGRRIPLPLAGFFLGCLPWTKNEGALLAVVVVAAYGVSLLTSPALRAESPRSFGKLALGALAPLAALVMFRLTWSQHSDFAEGVGGNFKDHILNPDRWRGSALGYWKELTNWNDWGAAWPLIAVCLLVGLKSSPWLRSPMLRFGILSSLACSIGWFMIYVLTPLDQKWHIATSMDRFIIQLFPMLAFWALVILGYERENQAALTPTRVKSLPNSIPNFPPANSITGAR